MTVDLTTTQLTVAEIYTITTTSGLIARFTSHDQNLLYNSNSYQSIPISRTNIAYHTDLQVDKVDVSFGLIGVTIGESLYSIPKIIRMGILRNAHVVISLIDYVALNFEKILFDGYITGGISYNRGVCTLSVGSILDKLNEKFPKYIYSEYCQHQLFGTYCGLDKLAWRGGSAITNSSDNTFYSPMLTYASSNENFYGKGEIQFTSGPNAGLSRSIIKHFDGYVKVLIPFPEVAEIDDEFYAWPGCDKSGFTCDYKFANYDNFMGFEFCPKPEVLIG